MKLRWKLVLSHFVSVLFALLVIGAINLVLLVGNTRALERDALERSLDSANQLLADRLQGLQRARDALARLAATSGEMTGDIATIARIHELLDLYRVERVEFYAGLRKVTEAYRWERGVSPELATVWLPGNPSIAAQVASGRSVTWLQINGSSTSALKLCATVPGASGGERRWIVLTEPLDGILLERILPSGLVGALERGQRLLVAWPETPPLPDRALTKLAGYLPSGPLSGFFQPVLVRRTAVRLDDGSTLRLALMGSAVASGASMLVGLRTWFLVGVGGAVLAFALGTGLASRLLDPLRALLAGTAAMARGHLMVRLPAGRQDELGSLMREFNRMADEIRDTYFGAISTLAEVVETKSHYTRAHIERVERLTMATAEVLERRGWVRFSSQQRFLLSVAAILHDVGKIGIADDILNKSGPLEAHEREQILSHPELGALIVERIGKLERAAEIIRCAHEHFDGSGYPRNLKGEEIPLESRIILAVDAYDAMIWDRPYSASRAGDEAIKELRAHAGTQFDPVVIEALIEAISTNVETRMDSDSGFYRAVVGEAEVRPELMPRPQADRE